MSPENSPAGYIDHRPDCQNPQPGWIPGSKNEIDSNLKKLETPQDASGDGYWGCITCGGPAMIGSPEQSKSTQK